MITKVSDAQWQRQKALASHSRTIFWYYLREVVDGIRFGPSRTCSLPSSLTYDAVAFEEALEMIEKWPEGNEHEMMVYVQGIHNEWRVASGRPARTCWCDNTPTCRRAGLPATNRRGQLLVGSPVLPTLPESQG